MGLILISKNLSFQVGLFIRILLLLVATPAIYNQWFLPFFETAIKFNLFSPWLANYGNISMIDSFPYGIVMFICLLPLLYLGQVFDIFLNTNIFSQFFLGFNILLIDFGVLYFLIKMAKSDAKRAILLYWLSPIVIYICYWHGQLDILPVSLLVWSICFVNLKKPIKVQNQ